MRPDWKAIGDFLLGVIRDPTSKDGSSARIAAMICMALASADVIVRLAKKEAPDAEALVALVGGGAVALLTRTKSE